MSESRGQLLTIGVFFIVVVVAILLYAANLIGNALNIFPMILLLFGVWMIVLAVIRAQSRQKYERSAFGTLEMGILLMGVGGAWLLFRASILYSIALLLLTLGIIAIVSALRRKKP